MPRSPYQPCSNETSSRTRDKTGLARALSKLGYCSRARAAEQIVAGRVRLNGRVCRHPEHPVDLRNDRLTVDGKTLCRAQPVYLMLNKPRGLITSAADESGRATIYSLLEQYQLPWVAPVGRLDKASEGLLLLSNDSAWAAHITAPESGIEKTYHVQVQGQIDTNRIALMTTGVRMPDHEVLTVRQAGILRVGQRNCWLEMTLHEGRNRHIRRLAAALNLEVLRLVRVAIGGLKLGTLAKGECRALTAADLDLIGAAHGAEH